jgi:hypothetical protein
MKHPKDPFSIRLEIKLDMGKKPKEEPEVEEMDEEDEEDED